MFFKNQIEVIPFNEFIRPPARVIQERKPHTPILFSLVPGMTMERFFDMSPEMVGLYAVVLGAGGIAILSHLVETQLAKSGDTKGAYVVERVTSYIFPIAVYSFTIWVVFKIADMFL